GKPSSRTDARSTSLKSIAAILSAGGAVVIDTPDADATKGNALFESGRLVNLHAFWVRSVDLEKKTITLVNPWGWGDDSDLVTLTEGQFHDSMRLVFANALH
ncbi:MAG: hypothetical protein HY925_04060, partial [Elusimicrobia bacterium]|nr:hypothetical protein [Elusimicrobiota bacterium]